MRDYMQEHKQSIHELQRLNRLLAVLSRIDQLLVRTSLRDESKKWAQSAYNHKPD